MNPSRSSKYSSLSLLDDFNNLAKLSEQRVPEMGFVFHPTILRVQQPHFILNELRQFKIQLDHSPIMDALFSPATVPIPPNIPWPSNFVAQQYLPPQDILTMPEYSERQQEHPQSYQAMSRTYSFPYMPTPETIQNSLHQSTSTNSELIQSRFKFPTMTTSSRRFEFGVIPSVESIQKSIQESINQNSGLFGAQFKMPDISKLINSKIGVSLNFIKLFCWLRSVEFIHKLCSYDQK